MRSRRILALPPLVALAAALAVAGCGSQNVDTDRGRQLFIQTCGGCHALAQAGTNGTVGPDLDAAFAQARASGMDHDTIAGVVRRQIEDPRPPNGSSAASMPAELLTGQDAEDVAAYVGDVAGVPGIKPPPFTPQSAFATNCGSCHTLAAANTSGTTGPDLDKVLPGLKPSEVLQSITDPNAKITPGYPAGVMPQNFGQTFTPQQLKALVKYLLANAGKR